MKKKKFKIIKKKTKKKHRLCTQFQQEMIEFAPTPFIHAPHGNLTDAIFDFETSRLEHKTWSSQRLP